MERSPEIRTVSATEAKNRFGEILKGVYQSAEHIVVERDSIPVAVIVPIQDYTSLNDKSGKPLAKPYFDENESEEARARYRLKRFLDKLAETSPDYPEDQVERDIEEAIQAVRRK